MKFLLLLVPMIVVAVMIDANSISEVIPNTYQGFPYPIIGFEHVIVMLAVGMLASRYAGVRRWLLPAAFLIAMSVGLAVGLRDVSDNLRPAELMVMVSLVISLLLALSGRTPRLSIVVPLFSVLAFVHGYAHGIQIPSDLDAVACSRGIIVATAILLLSGMALGIALRLFSRFLRHEDPQALPTEG